MHIRYWNKEQRKFILKTEYDDSYYNAGAINLLKLFGYFLFLLLSFFLIAIIYATIIHGPND